MKCFNDSNPVHKEKLNLTLAKLICIYKRAYSMSLISVIFLFAHFLNLM